MSKRYRVTIEGEVAGVSNGVPAVGQRWSNTPFWFVEDALLTEVEELPEPRTPEQERDAAIAVLRELCSTLEEPGEVLIRSDVDEVLAKHGVTL